MPKITEYFMQGAAEAAQRLVLATKGDIEYRTVDDFQHDVDCVVLLLELSRDACWPSLENRAREKARSEGS